MTSSLHSRALAVCVLILPACEDLGGGGKAAVNPGDCTEADGLQTCRTSGTSSSGVVSVPLNLNGGAGSFLITAEGRADTYLSVESIRDDSGTKVLDWEDWYYGDENLTAGILPLDPEMMINWPVRDDDAPLSAGTWSVDIAVIDYDGYYLNGESVDLVTQVKQDGDFANGTVQARVVYVDGLDQDPDIVAATEEASALWETIWASYGLGLTVAYDTAPDISSALPSMTDGGPEIEDISSEGSDADVTVVIGESVGGAFNIYGESGGIPGTLVANDHSAVAISWITNAGGDGVFSDDDVRVYGETLAHEVGHYMGLFHPVDYDNRYVPYSWDALADTDQCPDSDTCDSALGDNNMYPFPVCPSFNECTPQQALSDDQSGVVHRHAGAL